MSKLDTAKIAWRGTDTSTGLVFEIGKDGRWIVYSSDPSYAMLESGLQSINATRELTITIISKDAQYAVYVGDALFSYIDDSGRRPGVGIELCVWDQIGDPTVVKYDNLKVWDLDKVQNLP
jgi:hypothetical protein